MIIPNDRKRWPAKLKRSIIRAVNALGDEAYDFYLLLVYEYSINPKAALKSAQKKDRENYKNNYNKLYW